MRSSLPIFKVFPPPKFLLMPHAGLDITDDGMRCISYSGFGDGRKVASFGAEEFPEGLIAGGDIRNEADFVAKLTAFARAHALHTVKVSVPEEKAYLFQTDVPSTEQRSIEQNIEFKLEENVPLSAPDAVFYFDLLPRSVTGGMLRASVSVVPRTYVEHYTTLLAAAGLEPVSFEVAPKAIARAVVPNDTDKTRLIIHLMKGKTGLYVVSGNVVHFSFTAPWGTATAQGAFPTEELRKEIMRIRSYWLSHGNGMSIGEAIVVGAGAEAMLGRFAAVGTDLGIVFSLANIWSNALNLEKNIPPIPMNESLGYAVAAGLAFETPRNS